MMRLMMEMKIVMIRVMLDDDVWWHWWQIYTSKQTNKHRHTVVESKNQTNLDIVFVAIIRMVSSSSKMHLMIVAWTVSNDAFVALLPPDCNTTPIIEYKCRLDHHHLFHSNQHHHHHDPSDYNEQYHHHNYHTASYHL